MTMIDPETEERWSKLVAPWRDAAERLGFRFLERNVYGEPHDCMCIDFFLSDDSIFLDLAGSIVTRRVPRRMTGFCSANFLTYYESSGEKRELSTLAVPDPQPRPYGIGAKIIYACAPLLMRLAPKEHRPIPMKQPGDLGAILDRHRERMSSIGNILPIDRSAPLEDRWTWVGEIEARAEELLK